MKTDIKIKISTIKANIEQEYVNILLQNNQQTFYMVSQDLYINR